jgi:ATP-binding cassette subfamily G (WHITE) protein 2 (SNQ2)
LANVKAEISRMKDERIAAVGAAPPVEQSQYATPLSFQITQVVKRMNVQFWRTPNYGFTRLFNHVVIALLTGVVFVNLDNSRSSLQYRVFLIFQVTVLPSLILAQVEPMYDMV